MEHEVWDGLKRYLNSVSNGDTNTHGAISSAHASRARIHWQSRVARTLP